MVLKGSMTGALSWDTWELGAPGQHGVKLVPGFARVAATASRDGTHLLAPRKLLRTHLFISVLAGWIGIIVYSSRV